MKKSLIALLLAAASLVWWIRKPPSEEEVVGAYAGEYKGFIDQVELTKNHKFNQALKTPEGETMKSSGTWKLTNKALDMDGYIFFIDEQVEGILEKPIRTSLTFSAYRGMLIRDWDSGFYKLSQQQK